jgi:hypothetical protein
MGQTNAETRVDQGGNYLEEAHPAFKFRPPDITLKSQQLS